MKSDNINELAAALVKAPASMTTGADGLVLVAGTMRDSNLSLG